MANIFHWLKTTLKYNTIRSKRLDHCFGSIKCCTTLLQGITGKLEGRKVRCCNYEWKWYKMICIQFYKHATFLYPGISKKLRNFGKQQKIWETSFGLKFWALEQSYQLPFLIFILRPEIKNNKIDWLGLSSLVEFTRQVQITCQIKLFYYFKFLVTIWILKKSQAGIPALQS